MPRATASDIPISQLKRYQKAAQQRHRRKAQGLALRRQCAWRVAQQAADVLKSQFAATQVVVFGSVLSPEHFHAHSDVDLAVWGLAEGTYYQAVGRLQGLDADIAIDLVEGELAPPALLATIQQTGVLL
jgi:predicted nucleotidyltransferase